MRTSKTMFTTPTTLCFFVATLLFASPTTNRNRNRNRNQNHSNDETIQYYAEAMSPTVELTATAAAAAVRRNVISGAAIFTIGDAAAQMLTNSRTKASSKKAIAVPVLDAIDVNVNVSEGPERKPIQLPMRGGGAKANRLLANTVTSLDMNRLFVSSILGAVWSGFCVPFVYGNVEKTFPGKANLKLILTKVLVTCSILSTIGNYGTMFARRFIAQYTTYQFDKSSSLRLKWFSKPIESILLFLAILKGCFRSCNRDIGEVIVDDLKIWPLYDLTCYSIIPPAWRPIATSIMSSGWAMYMSVASAKGEEDSCEEEEDIAASVGASTLTLTPKLASLSPVNPATRKLPIQVTPLQNPFPKTQAASTVARKPSPVATSERTMRLISVTGGTTASASGASTYNHNNNSRFTNSGAITYNHNNNSRFTNSNSNSQASPRNTDDENENDDAAMVRN